MLSVRSGFQQLEIFDVKRLNSAVMCRPDCIIFTLYNFFNVY